MECRAYTQKKKKSGFTLAEFLVVVAITMILAGVSFVAAIHYQSRLRRLEMDKTAREIFLAAQNRLSLEFSGGSLERILAKEPDSEEKLGFSLNDQEKEGLYCILYQPGPDGQKPSEDIRERLLPFGSIDETVRTDGSYLIVYDPEKGEVREVWYSDRYVFQATDAGSSDLSDAAQSPKKREHYKGYAIGYYGGDTVANENIPPAKGLKKPELTLFNGDILYVEVMDYLSETSQHSMKLWIEGVSSGAKGWMNVMDDTRRGRVVKIGTSGLSRVILDDIAWQSGRFAELNRTLERSNGGNDKNLIPGEDIRVYAEVSNSSGSAVSEVYQCSSLFAGISEGKVRISNIRHLENLDYRISAFNPGADGEKLELTPVEEAPKTYGVVQQEDISWMDFRHNVSVIHGTHATAERRENNISVYYMTGSGTNTSMTKTADGCFAPVEPQFALDYEGNTREIRDMLVHTTGGTLSGGCFGTVKKNLTVRNLKLVRPDVTSETSSGALIGFGNDSALEISVENVLVQYPNILTEGKKTATSSTEADAGALIGAFKGKELTIKKTMAANTYRSRILSDGETAADLPETEAAVLKIRSKYGAAGGLAGSVNGNVTFSGCASSVYVDAYGLAGGLVANVKTTGSSQSVHIENSYVAGHTSEGKFRINPVPSDAVFDTTSGRYNVISRNELAGGLAAVLPAVSQVERTYVTASVYVYSQSYGTVPPASEEEQKMKQADRLQKEAAFVTMCGNINAGQSVSGKTAADLSFPYCYSASMVNGAWALSYAAELEPYFKAAEGEIENRRAFAYDENLADTYPMPTVVQLIKEDPASSGIIQDEMNVETSGLRQIPKFARVHIGDWMEPPARNGDEEESAEELNLYNGNRLWVDYITTKPASTGNATTEPPRYLTFSVTGETSGHTVYYILKYDRGLNTVLYYEDTVPSAIVSVKENEDNWTGPWKNPDTMTSKRFKVSETEDGRLKFSFYLDSKAFPLSGCQFLDSNAGKSIVPGENIVVRASEKHTIPDSTDLYQEANSFFEKLTGNGDGTFTAKIANARHLVNLGFYDADKVKITDAEQTDNILWDEDTDITAQTPAYCAELADAYPGLDVRIYNGSEACTAEGNFRSIENGELDSYDGKGYTIAQLKISSRQQGNANAALFLKNGHLNVTDLNLTDPNISAARNGAVLIADAEGGIWKDSCLQLDHVRVYGDNVSVQAPKAGGIAANVNVRKVTMKNVYVYGRDALVGGAGDASSAGGLAGSLKADEMEISNCAFSGYISGKNYMNGVGGLVGSLDLSGSETGPGKPMPVIKDCYTAGRNNSCGNPDLPGGDDRLKNEFNITGGGNVGGLVGTGRGILQITNSFSNAGVFGYALGTEGSTGGLMGRFDNTARLNLTDSYFGGSVGMAEQGNADACLGYIIGRLNRVLAGTTVPAPVTAMENCAYQQRDQLKPIGSEASGTITGISNSLAGFKNPATALPVTTIPYDSRLENSAYPYKMWTLEDERAVYRGDWR